MAGFTVMGQLDEMGTALLLLLLQLQVQLSCGWLCFFGGNRGRLLCEREGYIHHMSKIDPRFYWLLSD